MSKFDLSQFETLDTATLTVQTPKGDDLLVDGKPVTITVYGEGSKKFVNAKYKLDNAMQTKAVAAYRGKKTSVEEQTQLRAEFLAAVTASIDNFPIEGGALALYNNPKLSYITAQVDKFLGETENFMPA
jgi:hypothetical protein